MSLDVYLENGSGEGYWANITHNLGKMAGEAGIYEALWRPEELLDPATASVMDDAEKEHGYHSEQATALRKQLEAIPVKARDLIVPLNAGLTLLKSDPARFEQFNASNGWGKYEHFVPFVEKYLQACVNNPDADVRVSR